MSSAARPTILIGQRGWWASLRSTPPYSFSNLAKDYPARLDEPIDPGHFAILAFRVISTTVGLAKRSTGTSTEGWKGRRR